MKNYTFCLILFLLLPVLYCDAKPKAQFLETVYDFGTVKQETSVKHTFIFKNTGNSTLAIERVKAGWGCTGTLLSEKEIPAGGSGELEIELHTDMRTGEIVKTIYVYTNDPDHPVIKIIVKATVTDE